MSPHRLSIMGGLVFDGVTAEPTSHPVHVEGGKIVGVGGPPPGGAEVIEAEGCLVTPGFLDLHFHAYGVSLDSRELEGLPLSYVAAKAAKRLQAALGRGFTTVRDVAGGDIGLRMSLDEGLIPGPRYLFSGPGLSQTGGHGDMRPGHLSGGLLCSHLCEVVDGVDPLRAAARERFRTGAHVIKLFTSGGVFSPTDPLRNPQYSADEVAAVCYEATARGSYVAAHAYSPEAILHSVRNGVRTIEHGNLLDEESAALMAEVGAYLVPTLGCYDSMDRRGDQLGLPKVSQEKNREVLHRGLDSIAIARQAGIRIGLGTDLMGDLEDDQLFEFRTRCQVDEVADVLRSATSVNAEIIGRPDLGSIRVGAIADLVILEGNPFDQPQALWDGGRTVIQSGKVVGS